MKKILSLSIALAILAFVVSPVLALKPENKPEKSQGPHEKVTGEFTAMAGSIGLSMKIEAHNTSPDVKGSVSYSNTLGGYFEGIVDICYRQEDNKAILEDLSFLEVPTLKNIFILKW